MTFRRRSHLRDVLAARLAAYIPRRMPGRRRYQVTLVTGRAPRADTGASVQLRLLGVLEDVVRDSGWRRLPFDGRLAAGSVCRLVLSAPPLGEVKTFQVRHDGSGDAPAWLLDLARVRDLTSGREWLFPCFDWLARPRGARFATRELAAIDGLVTRGPFRARRERVAFPVPREIAFREYTAGDWTVARPAAVPAVVHYPGVHPGETGRIAPGAAWPVVVCAHGRRLPPAADPRWRVCEGAPADTAGDHRQLDSTLAHLASWGFVSIAPDLHWLASESIDSWRLVLRGALRWLLDGGFEHRARLDRGAVGLLGHSTGGAACARLATSADLPPRARVRATVLLAPAAASTDALDPPPAFGPALVLSGGADVGAFGARGGAEAHFLAAAAPKRLVAVEGANHFGFTDRLCIAEDGHDLPASSQRRVLRAYATAFLRRWLRGVRNHDGLLRGAQSVAGLGTFTIEGERLAADAYRIALRRR